MIHHGIIKLVSATAVAFTVLVLFVIGVYNPEIYREISPIVSRMVISDDQDATNVSSDPECGYLVRSAWRNYLRLGNRMFFYASFYGMVKNQEKLGASKTVFLQPFDEPMALHEIFENLTLPVRTVSNESWFREQNFTELQENACLMYDGRGLDNFRCDGKNIRVSGYRQSYKYFYSYSEDIRREFKFRKAIKEKCETTFNDALASRGLARNRCATVGVHLRRGDMLPGSPMNSNQQFVPASMEYFRKAVSFHETQFLSRLDRRHGSRDCLAFLIFGDDPEWNEKAAETVDLLRPNNTHLIIMHKNAPAVDLCQMTLCDHMAMSVGTFGWWAGYFSRGIVTYQKEYVGASLRNELKPEDVFLPHWIAL